jgi:hypothetical protein
MYIRLNTSGFSGAVQSAAFSFETKNQAAIAEQ